MIGPLKARSQRGAGGGTPDVSRRERPEAAGAGAYLFFRFVATGDEAGATVPEALPDLETVARRLRDADGIRVGARRRHLLWYDDSCTGRAVSDWLRKRFVLTDTAAAGVARELMRRGDIVHVFDDRPFEASGDLYRLR